MQDIDTKKAAELEEKFDPEMRFRPLLPPATLIVAGLLITLSCFHYYTAGFGLLRETTHRGVHLAFVLGLIFLVFSASKKAADEPMRLLVKPLLRLRRRQSLRSAEQHLQSAVEEIVAQNLNGDKS